VVGTVLVILQVAVQHGAVGVQAQLMGNAGRLQPFVAVDFVIADDPPHALVENLGAA
jgi:hypothetical protein